MTPRVIWEVLKQAAQAVGIEKQSLVADILRNPSYAGAYVWGRRPMETSLIEGRLKKRQGPYRRPHDCRVFIAGHHAAYIDWATYEEN